MVPIEPQRLNQAERNEGSEQHRLKSRMIREKRTDLQMHTQHMIRRVRVRFETNEQKIRQKRRWIALPIKPYYAEGMGNMEGNKEDEAKEGLTFPRVRTHHNIAMVSAFSQGFTKARKRNGGAISKGTMVSASSKATKQQSIQTSPQQKQRRKRGVVFQTTTTEHSKRAEGAAKTKPSRAESPNEARNTQGTGKTGILKSQTR
jgi:hypothetical protein